jgi:hypothetical protein
MFHRMSIQLKEAFLNLFFFVKYDRMWFLNGQQVKSTILPARGHCPRKLETTLLNNISTISLHWELAISIFPGTEIIKSSFSLHYPPTNYINCIELVDDHLR